MATDHHHHLHHSGHSLGRLSDKAKRSPTVHRIGRRKFLTDLGRGSFAVAILGLAACTDSPSSAPSTTTSTPASGGGTGLQWAQVRDGSVSAYLLIRGSTVAVVDTGTGATADIGTTLADLGLNFDNIEHVILTHKHPDHIGGLGELVAAVPAASLYAGAADIGSIQSSNPLVAIGDGDSVFGLDVYNTPGHTPGSISVIDSEIGLLVAGDALNGSNDGTELTGANPAFSEDMALAGQSIQKLAALDVNTALMGHGSPVVDGAGPLLSELAASL